VSVATASSPHATLLHGRPLTMPLSLFESG
jgi:hypothetical protein